MLVASLDATCGSVIKNAERISPLSNGSSHFLFCASLPYFARTSILPVSGAAQLVAYATFSMMPSMSSSHYLASRTPYLFIFTLVHPQDHMHTSLAVLLFPRYSAISPYSKLLNPAPSLKWFFGRNMFHSPSFFALAFSSSMTGGWLEKRCSVVSPIWRAKTASAGMHSSSTNFST